MNGTRRLKVKVYCDAETPHDIEIELDTANDTDLDEVFDIVGGRLHPSYRRARARARTCFVDCLQNGKLLGYTDNIDAKHSLSLRLIQTWSQALIFLRSQPSNLAFPKRKIYGTS